MEVFLLILRLVFAVVFGTAGLAKLFDRAGAEKAFAEFGVPEAFVRPLVYILPVVEITIAVSLLFVSSSWFGAIGAASVLLVFTIAMLYQMAKGNSPDCHCFGQLHSEPVGVSSVLRNVGLLALSVFLIAQGSGVQGVSLINSNQDIMLFVLGLAVVGLLAASVFFLKRISDQQTEIMRRIELIELVGQSGAAVEREAAHPNEGLPIGARVPDFELPSAGGESVSLAGLLGRHKPVLFFFVSPTCAPCRALVPNFEQWQRDLGDKVQFVFVSNGDAGDNLEKFGGEAAKQILVQKEREVAELLKAQWTPTAVLMDRHGRIASHVAAGDTAIKNLVEQIAARDLDGEFTYFSNGNGHSHRIKIGESVPRFSLTDLKGKTIDAEYFKGKKTLVTFWSLSCPYCVNMMDELSEWDRTRGKDDPALIVFSDGDKAAHQKIDLVSPIVLDDGHKTSAGFGMFGTPSAVLVNEQGKIVSETAVGAPDIWSLIGRRK
jgi:peroxiredoxin/uncharacterized membrane protein YphA (DoxX/SURF4 family)